MKPSSAAAPAKNQKAAKSKKTRAKKASPRSRREIFLTITDALADWLEEKMNLRGESKPQPFIYELLQQRREQELTQAT